MEVATPAADLSPEDLATLMALLNRIRTTLGAARIPARPGPGPGPGRGPVRVPAPRPADRPPR
jgi:hypothetical protein